MKDNFPASLKHVLRHEGGYSNHPNDAGGKTNYGVIQSVYDSYRRKKGLIPRSVKSITSEEVHDIYRTLYWNKIEGDSLPIGIDYCVFDAAVNSGPGRGARWLQQAVNKVAKSNRLKVDDNIGPSTLDASDDYDPVAIVDAMLDYRLGFMKVARNSKTGKALWPSFGAGWSNRLYGYLPKGASVRQVNGVDDVAKKMIHDSVGTQPTMKYPRPETPPVPSDKQLPGWVVAIIMAIIAALGVMQWQQ
jgi:lysozyme family protein